MLIESIEINNFRNFGKETIQFSTDPERNFTIVLGQNTFGKTTLVKAFIWCLYRQNLFRDKNLLNRDQEITMSAGDKRDVSVTLRLKHGGYLYKITTKEVYVMTQSGSLSVINKASTSILKTDVSGNAKLVRPGDVEEEIDSILRPELKEYFFFDGETNTIQGVASKRNLTQAVINILRLNRIEMLCDYFDPKSSNGVYRSLSDELQTDLDDFDLAECDDNLEKYGEERRKCEEDIENISEEIKKLEGQRKSQEDILDENQDVQEDQKEKMRLKQKLKEDSQDKETSYQNTIKAFNASNCFARILFAQAFSKFNLKDKLSRSSFRSGSSYRGISEEAVNDLIKSGRCLCGAVIENGNEAHRHLLEAKLHMEPHDYGKYSSDFISAEESNLYSANNSANHMKRAAGEVVDLIEELDNSRERLNKITKRIEGRVDVGAIQKRIREISEQIGYKLRELEHKKEDALPTINDKIEKLNRKKEQNCKKSKDNDYIKKCLLYVDNIHRLASNKIKKEKDKIRSDLESLVGGIFSDMYHGHRSIVIDQDFRADTVWREGGVDNNLDKSTGLTTVVNYAFVTGLMELAKNYRLDDEDIDDDTLPDIYPLVMDAPFSNVDSEHIQNICTALAKHCDQVIMFVMEKDFQHAQETIRPRLGKIYRLDKTSETLAQLVEEKM